MKSKELDQFYTKQLVAKNCYSKIKNFIDNNKSISSTLWLEPSAGAGSFYSLLPKNKRLGLDLDPKISGVLCHDFLSYPLERNDYLTIGNPPFGKNSSLAVKFFNKCAEHSQIIAFVLPKTFKKASILNKLNSFFVLAEEHELPDFSFEFEGVSYDVPTVFQIWIKSTTSRSPTILTKTHADFSFTTKENADFAIQRVGGAAGKIKDDFEKYAVASHYFIKGSEEVKKIFKKINWNEVKYNTAGNPSISKTELIELYQKEKTKN